MSQYRTTNEATKQWLGPVARTVSDAKAKSGCKDKACALWRWKPRLATDRAFPTSHRETFLGLIVEGQLKRYPDKRIQELMVSVGFAGMFGLSTQRH